MWLMTTQGFYSAVENWHDRETVLVRGRVRADLKRLSRQLPDADINRRIYRDRSADYPYRLKLTKEEWATATARLAKGIDYGNFKGAVSKRLGHKRAGVYHRVWSVLLDLERDAWGRWAKSAPRWPKLTGKLTGTRTYLPKDDRDDLTTCPACDGSGNAPDNILDACACCRGFGTAFPEDIVTWEADRDDTLESPDDEAALFWAAQQQLLAEEIPAGKRGSRR